jgi:hypothetical protein
MAFGVERGERIAMSYARALDAINGRSTDGVAHFEILDHPRFMQELIGYDPWQNPVRAYADAYRALDMDWIVGIPRRSVRLAEGQSSRVAEDGTMYTEWGLSGSSWRHHYLFHDEESVLAFDPVSNLVGEELVTPEHNRKAIENRRADQALLGDATLVSGLYYTTLFQFGIMALGWELFLSAAAGHPERFQRVLEGFAEVSRRNVAAWVDEGLDLLFLHDDIAIERGLVCHPEWYRKRLFPLYERLLEPVRACKGLKVAFVSDGDYTPLIDDLAALGFDGFVLNTAAHLGELAKRLGKRAFLSGNVDTNVLTLGTPDDVRREVQRCLREAEPAGGFILHACGDLPHNIPLANMRAYFAATGRL